MIRRVTRKLFQWWKILIQNWKIKKKLIQLKQKTFQDVIYFNNKLNVEFIHLKDYSDSYEPWITSGARYLFKDLTKRSDDLMKELFKIISEYFKNSDKKYKSLELETLLIPSERRD